jgi:hypothetical protein
MPKSTSHHPGMYPMRIQARRGSLVEQRYFSTIVAPIVAQHVGDEGRTDDALTPAPSGVQR